MSRADPTVAHDLIPPPLVMALRRAHEAELTAMGEWRRPAFRLTRSLLGGARVAGFPASSLAECLGVSVGSVRTRGGSDGRVPVRAFAELAGLSMDEIDRWAGMGLLEGENTDELGETHYLASVLVRALVRATRSVR